LWLILKLEGPDATGLRISTFPENNVLKRKPFITSSIKMPSPVTDILVGLRLSNSVQLHGALMFGGSEATCWISDFCNFHSYLAL